VRVISVAAGGFTSLAVTTDGEAYAWGKGVHADAEYGEDDGEPTLVLGLELTEDQLVPLKYPGLCLCMSE
jgi:alpha-tubulin suppressor-like RCC1 family protein